MDLESQERRADFTECLNAPNLQATERVIEPAWDREPEGEDSGVSGSFLIEFQWMSPVPILLFQVSYLQYITARFISLSYSFLDFIYPFTIVARKAVLQGKPVAGQLPSQEAWQWSSQVIINIPILKTRELRLSEDETLVLRRRASKWQHWDLDTHVLIPIVWLFALLALIQQILNFHEVEAFTFYIYSYILWRDRSC